MDEFTDNGGGHLAHHEADQEGADEPNFGSRGRGRVEVLSGGYRRRSWTPQEKARITQESFGTGARVAEVARSYGVSEGLLYQWRKKVLQSGGGRTTFVPVELDDRGTAAVTATATIEIDLGGATIRLNGAVDADLLRVVLTAVRPRG